MSVEKPPPSQNGGSEKTAFYSTFICLCICVFIATIDTVIVAASLPAIASSLHATSNEAYWCGSGFLFAQTVAQPIYGAFADTFGHKSCLMAALSVFTTASLFCATAQSMVWLVAARVFQGLGSAGINVMVNVVTADLVPLDKRAKYAGLVSLFGACGLCCGVVIGGAVSERASWRWIFYINLPICIPTMIAIYFSLYQKPTTKFVLLSLKSFDWTGMLLLTGSLIGVLYGVTGGGVLSSWTSASILSSLIIGGIGLVVTMLYERFVATSPMIPPRVFRDRTAVLGYLMTACHALVLWTYAYFITLYFVVSKRHSLLGSAVASLAAIAVVPFAAALGGIVMTLLKSFKWVNVLAAAALTIGFSLMTTLSTVSSIANITGFQILSGIGGGILFPGRLIAVQAPQKVEDVSIATALVSFFTSFGQSFGVAIGGAVFQNRWDVEVQKRVARGLISSEFVIMSKNAEQTAAIMKAFPESIREVYRPVMSSTISVIWIVVASFAGLALLACLGMRDISLDNTLESKESKAELIENSENNV